MPRTNDFEDTGGPFFLDGALTQPGPLLDHQVLCLPTATAGPRACRQQTSRAIRQRCTPAPEGRLGPRWRDSRRRRDR
jgi:hypothetical protein